MAAGPSPHGCGGPWTKLEATSACSFKLAYGVGRGRELGGSCVAAWSKRQLSHALGSLDNGRQPEENGACTWALPITFGLPSRRLGLPVWVCRTIIVSY